MQIGIKPLNRALYEGLLLNFQIILNESNKIIMRDFLLEKMQLQLSPKSLLQPGVRPGGKTSDASEWILVKPFWMRAGPNTMMGM